MIAEGINQYFDYKRAKNQAKYAKKMQEWRNKMTRLSDAINQNAITQNTTMAIQQSAKRAVYQKADEISLLGASNVNAAAAGVRGNSVSATLLQFQRGAALQEKNRQDDLKNQFTQLYQQRITSGMSAAQHIDHSYIRSPKFGEYLFAFAAETAADMEDKFTKVITGGKASGRGVDTTPLKSTIKYSSGNNWGVGQIY